MAAANTSIAADPVKQFSVFTANRVGRLNELITLLGNADVHVMAIATLDTTDSSIVRLVLDDPDGARTLLKREGFSHSETDILAVEITAESDVKAVLAALLEAEVNLHYIYSFIQRPEGKHALVLSVEDIEIASHALNHRGFKVLSQRDIAR